VRTPPTIPVLLALAVLLPVCGLLFVHRLADRELNSSHEARAAQNAQMILDSGDWGLPRLFDRRPELQKPPLYYWLVAALARLSGGRVDAWAVRLPAALAALGTVLLVFGLCAARGRPVAGLIAAMVLATSLHFTWLARVGRIDMPLTFTVALALAGFYLGRCRLREREGRGAWRWFLIAYLAVGVGLLLKGPIAVALPLVALCAYAVSARLERVAGASNVPGERGSLRAGGERERAGSVSDGGTCPVAYASGSSRGNRLALLARAWGLWWGLPLMLAVALPWYLWANAQTNGELFRVFFWHHNFDRGFGGEGGLAAHPWWFYGPRLAVDLLPWSLVLPLAAWSLWRRRDPEARLAAAWLLAMVVFLSCMRFKRADYLLPAYPGAALLLGCAAEGWLRRPRLARGLAVGLVLASAACAAAWLGYLEYVAPGREASRPDRRFAEEVRRCTAGPVLFFRAEAHAVAFHVGRPLQTILEWENLDVWAGKPRSILVIMPAEYVAEWPRHLHAGRLVELRRTTDLTGRPHERPLVLLRTESGFERIPLPSAEEKLAKRN
jgi:4-amino-4-deoxy-L-arabinose transferase-like glycosyltransferase